MQSARLKPACGRENIRSINAQVHAELYDFPYFSGYSVLIRINPFRMIPLSEPYLNGNEWKYLKACLDSGWVSTSGSAVVEFEEAIAEYLGVPFAVACNSGTAALQLALRVAGVQSGDYVIVPNLTFVASLNAISHLGAIPLLLDVDPDTWQMDLDILEESLATQCEAGSNTWKADGKRIAAILPVHILGNMGDMKRLGQLIAGREIALVEDATEAMGTTFRGKHAGAWGRLGCLSFNGNKIMTTGGGGMILTSDENRMRHARHLSLQAKLPGTAYMHDEVGYNFRMPALAAALGRAQLEQFPEFLLRRKDIAARYRNALPHLRFQQSLPDCDSNHWLSTVWVEEKDVLIRHLQALEIQSRALWVPMNQLPMYKHLPYLTHNQVSQNLYDHCVSLPSSNGLTNTQLEQVIRAVNAISFA